MKTINHIAVIGGGVSGLALAIFARKQGIKVTIFEKQSTFSTIGAGVTLWPNGSFVLEKLCGLSKFTKYAGKPSLIRQLDGHDKVVSEFDISKLNSLCGLPTFSILRRDLIYVLVQELKALKARVYFGRKVGIDDVLKLQDQFDLVVGCEGRMSSPVREVLYQRTVTPKYQGFINIIGISQCRLSQGHDIIQDYRSCNNRFGIVPINKQLCYWAAAWPCEMDRARAESSWQKEMHQRFNQWPKNVQQALNYSEAGSVKHIFVHDMDSQPFWHYKNLIMIGDAAHAALPTSGQGACQALEDAWHLSQVLKSDKALDEVLKDFYNLRISKVSHAQNIGKQVARQIFFNKESVKSSGIGVSATQLSELYMQGLG
ncbi:FAD-dependent oxidoreductase [Pseudoalteromonas phenolica]|uniref:FAD dependent oxidoreductase n=1 Tax=Pseudoalteromonas phenolica TaxID=161398 RepID=A0A0S2JYC9_9GAMM|nr:FAD-dependent oxidoreductase [Pseudoalteromonas phenolica]ALO41146.1 FAD dependent oxidoreductase [Pseudoalteromonas phenolica]MBE0354322.1 hypothetical protein [Pseudoalteromonas phenolica O-BC30]RXF04257.1 FAD-dependent oxidoreductase [Pseudoalteromonas phenolica O-BC30]